ncbi:hypothetical protein K400107F7_16870 [Agathobaculum massiliense]
MKFSLGAYCLNRLKKLMTSARKNVRGISFFYAPPKMEGKVNVNKFGVCVPVRDAARMGV